MVGWSGADIRVLIIRERCRKFVFLHLLCLLVCLSAIIAVIIIRLSVVHNPSHLC
jgi:hypothetical protein